MINHSIAHRNNTRIIKKIQRTRDGSIIRKKSVLKKSTIIQPRVRIVTIRKRKVSGGDETSGASKRKRVRLSEYSSSSSRAMNRIVLPYEGTKSTTSTNDKHLLFFKTFPKLDG